MINNWIKLLVYFCLLVLFQVLILNHISFLGYATPFLYIYFIIKLPIGTNRNLVILLGFIVGLIIDLFCNTPGQNAAATTFAAFMIQPIQNLCFVPEDLDNVIPSIRNLRGAFMKYAVSIVFIHEAVLVSIASFSYYNFTTIILRIIFSTILTSILIFAIEGFSLRKKKHE